MSTINKFLALAIHLSAAYGETYEQFLSDT